MSAATSTPYRLTGQDRNLFKQIYPPLSDRRLADAKQKAFQFLKAKPGGECPEEKIEKWRQLLTDKQDAMFNDTPDYQIITIHDDELTSRDRRRITCAKGARVKP